VPLRARLAGELRGRGDKATAKAVLALRKPNAVAWALNQLARSGRDRLEAVHDARAVAEKVQAGGAVAELRAAIGAYRARLDDAVHWLEDRLAAAGSAPTKDQLRLARASLEAAAEDPKGYGAELATGSLVHAGGADEGAEELSFPAMAPPVTVAPVTVAPRVAPAPATPDEDGPVRQAARRLKEEARRLLDEATAELRAAESEEASARADVSRAEEKLAGATRVVGHARAKLEHARRALASAETKS
jgi:hypothetical protein